uniref:Uncharacterized protein n=1 Tax=Parascaris univalens TaxID=6257 RepID=A0A915CGX4_PARUN
MHTKKSEIATSPFSEEFPAPSHAHHIVDSNRDDSYRRVHVSGADMSNIFRAYRGRLNLSYWKTEDNQKVCEDAMELLNEISIERGCEPSVIISYVALVREVYSHACANIKQMKISDERRKIEMLKQWKQIERHFLKVKHAISECWPIGNETDLLTVYLSLALLYSLYKDVCDEGVITVCFEAAQRARRCGAYRLSKNEFAEIQQYCDTIENIYFLRKQRVLNGQSYFVDEPFVDKRNRENLGGPPPERAPYRRLPDGKAILAEYAASNGVRRAVNRNGSIFVETTTITVETFETRTQTTDESHPKSAIRTEKPMGVVRDQKVLVENYAELRLSDEEPPSVKEARFNLHTASLEGRSAEQVSHKQTELPSPPPKCLPPSTTLPLSDSPTEAAVYRAKPSEVSLSSSNPATSTTSEILLPRTTDSLLSGPSFTERPSHFATNSDITTSLLHSTANFATTLASPIPPVMHSPVEQNTISRAPKMHSPSLIVPHSALRRSSPSDPRESLPLPTTFFPSSTELSIPPTTTSSSLASTTTPSPTTSDSAPAAFSSPSSPINLSDSASPSSVTAPPAEIIKAIKDISASSASNATSDSSKVISSLIVFPPSSPPPPHSPPSYMPSSPTAQHAFLPSLTTMAPSSPFTASCTSSPTNVSSGTLPIPSAPLSPRTMPLSTASSPPSISTVSSTLHMTTPTYSYASSSFPSTLTLPVLPPAVSSSSPFTADSSFSSALIKSPDLPSPPQQPISTIPLPSKNVALPPSPRPSAPPPPPPPLSICSDLLPAIATSFSANVINTLAADSSPLTETMPSTHPSSLQSSASTATRPSVAPPPPPFSAPSVFDVQSKPAPSSITLSPRPPLHALKQNPSVTLPPRPVFLASSVFGESTPASATMLEATTPPFEPHSDSITPFRSSVSPRRPLRTPTSPTPHIVSLHGHTSIDTETLPSSSHNTFETLEHFSKRTLSADGAYLYHPTSAVKTEDLSKNSDRSGELIEQTTIGSAREIMNSEEMREYRESEGNLKTITDHTAISEVHQQVPLAGSSAMTVEVKETATENESEDVEESLHKAVSSTHQYEVPASLKGANLAVFSKILNDHEIAASDNASTEENRGYLPKATYEALDRLSRKDNKSPISELATSWAAHKSGDEWTMAPEEEHKTSSATDNTVHYEKIFSLDADITPIDNGNPTGNTNIWREGEEQQEIENGSPVIHTNDNVNLISFEETTGKQLQAAVTSASASDVSTVDATNDVPAGLVRSTGYSFDKNQHYSDAKHWEIENDDAEVKFENEFVESDRQNNKCNVDDDSDSEVTSFAKFCSNAAISKQHKITGGRSFDVQNHQDSSFSLLNELKRSFGTEKNTDNSQFVLPVFNQVKQVSEVIECTQRTVDEDDENEVQRIHLEEKPTINEEFDLEEQSFDVEEISKRQPQGFIPMHEEIISAISTLRHVGDLPKPNFDDAADDDASSIVQRYSRISQPKHAGRVFENPTTAFAGNLSTMDAEDHDSSASTPMTFFDPRLEFERRIKLKKNLKPKVDAPVIVKDMKTTETSLKRFSGLRSSHDVSAEDGKNTSSTIVSLDKDTNKLDKRSDSADSDGYYDTVSC